MHVAPPPLNFGNHYRHINIFAPPPPEKTTTNVPAPLRTMIERLMNAAMAYLFISKLSSTTKWPSGRQYGLRDVFGDRVGLRQGCVFHWTQAVWRKCQLLGLQSQYSSDGALQSYARKLLALPFLPAEHVEPTFQKLQSRATPVPLSLKELCSYISTTWLSGFWTPVDWSVFGRSIRTNIDVEGWHRRLNHKSSRPGLPL